jgi:23S rRNA (guanosine2251-2'-O)-methyltransferase
MVGGKRRRHSNRALLGSHQKCWLWGRHVVLETLRAGLWKPLEVWMADSLEERVAGEVRHCADQLSIEVVVQPAEELTRRCGKLEHQGLMAKMPLFPYSPVGDVWRQAQTPALYLILDGVEDPFNFGAMIRSAEVFGVDGIFVGTRHQSEVTAQVARSSAGAVNYVPIARAERLAELARDLRAQHVRVVAASEKAEQRAAAVDLRGPTALIIGSEGRGISDELRKVCDAAVAIPQSGRVGSLNAAVAAGILLYEVRRQRTCE